jgi:hypothetical protein
MTCSFQQVGGGGVPVPCVGDSGFPRPGTVAEEEEVPQNADFECNDLAEVFKACGFSTGLVLWGAWCHGLLSRLFRMYRFPTRSTWTIPRATSTWNRAATSRNLTATPTVALK